MSATLVEGQAFTTSRRTITLADITNYAGLSNDFNPLHVDEEFATKHFGRRIAHGQMIASIVSGLRSDLDSWPVTSYLHVSRRFGAPVGAGDTIKGHYTVSEVRDSRSRPGEAVVTVLLSVSNQEGDEVSSGEDVMLVKKPRDDSESGS